MAEYRIYATAPDNSQAFLVDTREQAMKLFAMATHSGIFDYVSIDEVTTEEETLCEWEAIK